MFVSQVNAFTLITYLALQGKWPVHWLSNWPRDHQSIFTAEPWRSSVMSVCLQVIHCNYALSSPTGSRWDWICWPARLNPVERIRSALTSSPVSGYTFPPSNFGVLSSIPSARKASGSLTPLLGQRALSALFRAVNIMHFFPQIICLLLSPADNRTYHFQAEDEQEFVM